MLDLHAKKKDDDGKRKENEEKYLSLVEVKTKDRKQMAKGGSQGNQLNAFSQHILQASAASPLHHPLFQLPRQSPSTLIIYDAYNCSNLCGLVCVRVYVCACACICAKAYNVQQTIFDTYGMWAWHGQGTLQQPFLKFTLEWPFCRCRQNVIVVDVLVLVLVLA